MGGGPPIYDGLCWSSDGRILAADGARMRIGSLAGVLVRASLEYVISGPCSNDGRVLAFVPERWRIDGGDIGPAPLCPYGDGLDCTGCRTPFASSPPGRTLAVEGVLGRRAVVPGAAILLRPSMPGEVREEGPGPDGNGYWSSPLLGVRDVCERGLGTRSGRLSPLRVLRVDADDGARARPSPLRVLKVEADDGARARPVGRVC